MRRRQASNPGNDHNIFILPSSNISVADGDGGDKYPSRHEGNRGLLIFVLIAVVVLVTVVFLMATKAGHDGHGKGEHAVPSSPIRHSVSTMPDIDTSHIVAHDNKPLPTPASTEENLADHPIMKELNEQTTTSTSMAIPDLDDDVEEDQVGKDPVQEDGIDADAGAAPGTGATDTYNEIQSKNKLPEPPGIPRRLIFTHKYNLLSPQDGDPPFDKSDPITLNVLHTFDTYKDYWATEDRRTFAKTGHHKGKISMNFLSDSDCLQLIAEVEPRLVQPFYTERHGEHKADICRTTALYTHGGVYFDVDTGVIKPIHFDELRVPMDTTDSMVEFHRTVTDARSGRYSEPGRDDVVTFVTAYDRDGRMFEAFTAATPKHPVMRRSLDYMAAYFEDKLESMLPEDVVERTKKANGDRFPSKNRPFGAGVGAFTLSLAYQTTSDDEWEEYVTRLMRDAGYSREIESNGEIPARRRHSRFLYEISLERDEVVASGLWADIPRQDAEYERKMKFCNHICFSGKEAYFYSRVKGSKICPIQQ